MDALAEFLSRAAAPLAAILDAAPGATRRRPVVFEHVVEAAQPFVAALVGKRAAEAGRRAWLVCDTPRAQELLHGELRNWLPEARLLPDSEAAAIEGAIADPEIAAERLTVLERLRGEEGPAVVVVHARTFDQAVPDQRSLASVTRTLRVGERVDREEFTGALLGHGYHQNPTVAERGQVAVRGGILDFFSWQHALPVRVEFFDDEIESIREFDPHQQTSVRTLDHCSVIVGEPPGQNRTLREYVRRGDLLVSVECVFEDAGVRITSAFDEDHAYDEALVFHPLELGGGAGGGQAARNVSLQELRAANVALRLREWDRAGFQLAVVCRQDRERPAVERLVEEYPHLRENLVLRAGDVLEGFLFPAGKLVVASGWELLGYSSHFGANFRPRVSRRDALAASRAQIDFNELKEGELVVHLEHGLGKFLGLEADPNAPAGGQEEGKEVMVLEFAERARLYVPLEQSYLVSRYVGLGKRHAPLSQLGDGRWEKAKQAAEKSVFDYAARMIKLQATREARHGYAFSPDTPWQREFENAFPYKETADQVTSIEATKADMEGSRPMDRLICGDVGFGKTEVAIRAAFKAVMGGKQVAMMVPTTVLAQQHFDNFAARMADFPVRVELLSRFRTAAQQRVAVEGLLDGSVDLVIGTHRIISKDVTFKDLGLLIVDEEQRFGVKAKERVKERFPTVDVLTLSATPIPRTLYLALTGARDLSTLETAPANRHSIETVICGFDERVIRDAIRRELDRQGQVFLLHNRIETIEKMRARVTALVPGAKVDIGHGQMSEGQLEDVMHRFVAGKTDVLVATSIIESGLDIPNANTIIIDRADRFGLADLYQLRGRVGRGEHKAYAYLMLPRDFIQAGEAKKRINAIRQYSSLGAGFKIALRDLEIRGAGNILGTAQSGHISAVGFDLYCQLLKQAVAQLKGEKVQPRIEVNLRLDFVATTEAEFLQRTHPDAEVVAGVGAFVTPKKKAPGEEVNPFPPAAVLPAFLPAEYLEEPRLRIQAYRQLAAVTDVSGLRDLRAAWRDRFGPLPPPVENLASLSELRLAAAARGVTQVETKGAKLMLTQRGDLVMVEGKFPRLTSPEPENRLAEIFALLPRFTR